MTAALTAATATPDTAVLVVLRYRLPPRRRPRRRPIPASSMWAGDVCCAVSGNRDAAPVLNRGAGDDGDPDRRYLDSTPDLLTAGFLALARRSRGNKHLGVALNVLRALNVKRDRGHGYADRAVGACCSLTILRSLSAQLLAATATPDTAVLLVARLMVAAMLAQTNTPLADLSVPVAGADAWWLRVPVILAAE